MAQIGADKPSSNTRICGSGHSAYTQTDLPFGRSASHIPGTLAAIFLDPCLNNIYTFIMEAKIQKWGNSLGIRIPGNIIKSLSLRNGSIVDIEKEIDTIVIRPKEKHNLVDMLNSISDANIHTEFNFGMTEGEEIW
jgi:antitoxin MazE